MMKKRIGSLLLALAMVFAMLPMQAFAAATWVAYDENSGRNMTITVVDDSGNPVNDAQVSVAMYYYNGDYTYECVSVGKGQYKFTKNINSLFYNYVIDVTAAGYTSGSTKVAASTSGTTVTLTKLAAVEDEYAEFRVFYIANGIVPASYAGAGEAVNYGPSANNTPLVVINVNLTKLRAIAAEANSPVVYNVGSSSGNQWEFIPAGNRTDGNFMERVKAFWDAVVSCMDEESVYRFQETGLYSVFMAYCLKLQGDGSIHADGVLTANPPVYVVELYEKHIGTDYNPVYFGGGVTGKDDTFLTAYNLLDQYTNRLKKNITWDVYQETGKPRLHEADEQCKYPHYTGTYIDPETNKIHTIWVYQYNYAGAVYPENDNGVSEIPYVKQSDTYYLAQFNMDIDAGVAVNYLVTYTDGVDGIEIFTDYEFSAELGQTVPPFTGSTNREDHIFVGWYLDVDKKIYSDADIANMTVAGDMVFHAVWTAEPKYTATVKVVLNGTYNTTTQTLISGQLVDADTVFEDKDDVALYVSADGVKYTQLGRAETGVYTAVLKNGTYHIYYGQDSEYVRFADQTIIMENTDRTRYLFFNSVTYNPNGGLYEGSQNVHTEYHYSGNAVNVCEKMPVRDGYIFLGWKDRDGNILQPGQPLTDSISRAYELTAQWAEAVDVYVEVTIRHQAETGGVDQTDDRRDITFTVDSREPGSTGDYTELNSWTIDTTLTNWEYGKTVVAGDPEYNGTNENHVTTYIPQSANLVGVRGDMDYTVTTHKSGYSLVKVTQTKEDGKIILHAELVYDPEIADLTYHVKVHEDVEGRPEWWPAAVHVKVTSWYDSLDVEGEQGAWNTITPMMETYERIVLDTNGVGSGSYPVWIWHSENHSVPYRYRIEVVSYELQDGTIVTADDPDYPNVQYVSENKRYFADVVVENGKSPTTGELPGAYFENNTQIGTITAIISIPAYTVTLNPNGGKLNDSVDSTVLTEQIIVPDITAYVPVREGGYLFEGWYLADAQGNMTDTQVLAGTALTSDITLLAKWRDPITVSGLVSVAGTYEQTNKDGSVTIQYIYDVDRAPVVHVLLQKKLPSGYYETVDQQYVDLDYTKKEYYFQKTDDLLVPVGVGEYAFPNLPDDGTQYRIFILSANYHSTYQNEWKNASVVNRLLYDTYTLDDYVALLGDVDPNVATVNAHLHFEPASFNLEYRVDAVQIGEGFRPDSAEVLVTYNGDPSITEPSQWPVISQMIFDGVKKGDGVTLTDGIGNGTTSVWQHSSDGATIYGYGICVPSITTDGVKTAYNKDTAPFTITYHAPTHYDATIGKQNHELIAYLIPNTYSINYVTNGGFIYGEHVTTHTWSKTTVLSEVVPVRNGYVFGGWYLDKDLTVPLNFDAIDASVAQGYTFYAKWTQVNVHLQVVIDHEGVTGTTADMNKMLYAQLSSRLADSQNDFQTMEGYQKSYESYVWHNHNEEYSMDIFEVRNVYTGLSEEWDYNLEVSLDGHYVIDSYSFIGSEDMNNVFTTGVEKVVTKSETDTVYDHYVTVCLKYDPMSQFKVIFHTNNKKALGEDAFRTYYPATMSLPAGENYSLDQDGAVPVFYDIPQFDYTTHNDYIFKGWYDAQNNAVKWEDITLANATEDLHLYAHWIEVGTVDKEEKDKKQTGSDTYHGYDLVGAQIRDQEDDEMAHYGNPGSGLRFVTVLSKSVYDQINAIKGNEAGAEYGFVVAKSATAMNYAAGAQGYTLQYAGENVNGINTVTAYKYVKNMKCSGVVDHYEGDTYRLYTAVITYGSQQGDALEAAYATDFVARSYIRYKDANGLLRTYYNNYTGTQLYGGCSVSFATVRDVVTGQ